MVKEGERGAVPGKLGREEKIKKREQTESKQILETDDAREWKVF